MSLLKIARLGDPILRERAAEVDEAEITTSSLQNLIDDMIQTMRDGEGVGLAAPQVHSSKRLFIVEVKGSNPRYPHRKHVPLTAILNPEIVEHSVETEEDWEGCLSIPDLRGRVPRWKAVILKGLDRSGKPLTLEANDFFARVIQHELDHLDGKIFLERMRDFSSLTHLREFERFWNAAKK